MMVLFSTARFTANDFRIYIDINRKSVLLKFTYLFLQVLDLVLTVLATSSGITELNPIMNVILGSPLKLILVKLLVPLLIAWFVPGKLLIPAIILLAGVIGWNIKELLLLGF